MNFRIVARPALAALLLCGPVALAHAQAFSSVSSASIAPTAPTAASSAPVQAPVGASSAVALGGVAQPFSSVTADGREVAPDSGAGPSLAAEPAGGTADFALADRILIEKGARRLTLLDGGRPIAEYPVRLGLNPYGHKEREGDFRTPEGVYRLSRRNPRSEFFLSVEVSYPNDTDRARARRAGVRPGGSIMIHGQPNVPRKAPDYYAANDWTDGCIAVSNSDMVDIWLRTQVGIPIEIRP